MCLSESQGDCLSKKPTRTQLRRAHRYFTQYIQKALSQSGFSFLKYSVPSLHCTVAVAPRRPLLYFSKSFLSVFFFLNVSPVIVPLSGISAACSRRRSVLQCPALPRLREDEDFAAPTSTFVSCFLSILLSSLSSNYRPRSLLVLQKTSIFCTTGKNSLQTKSDAYARTSVVRHMRKFVQRRLRRMCGTLSVELCAYQPVICSLFVEYLFCSVFLEYLSRYLNTAVMSLDCRIF